MKKIVKRTVSTVLALAMSATMAVGMSTSASAATATAPNAPYITVNSYRSYVGGRCDLTIDWNKVTNATAYWVEYWETVKENGKERCVKYNGYRTTATSASFSNLSASDGWPAKSKYDISVTPINGNVYGKTAHLYDSKDFIKIHVPCMSDVNKDSIKYSATSNSIALSWNDTNITDHSTMGYQVTLKNKATNKTIIRTTGSKSYTFKNLPKGTYNVSFKSYVIGYAGTMIKDTDTVNFNTNIVVK